VIAALSLCLCPVHGDVGVTEEVVHRRHARRVDGDADARPGVDRHVGDEQRLIERGKEARGDVDRPALIGEVAVAVNQWSGPAHEGAAGGPAAP
jgi:hypothetical protein